MEIFIFKKSNRRADHTVVKPLSDPKMKFKRLIGLHNKVPHWNDEGLLEFEFHKSKQKQIEELLRK
jgi:hypothetical protein